MNRRIWALPINIILFNLCYLIPFRKKDLWVYGAREGCKYDDNSMYLFEYMNKNHPEIESIWLTGNIKALELVRAKGYKAYLNNSFKGKKLQVRAGVVVYSHGLIDFGTFPLVAGAELVAVWHGMGFKKIYNGKFTGWKLKFKKALDHLFSWTRRTITPVTSQYSKDWANEMFTLNYDDIVVTGQPRNDVFKFADKERHQLFLEPESAYYPDLYLQGFSTSMPVDVQDKMVHSLKGLEHVKILKYAYAIEYDAINPLQMYPSEESKIIKNLYTAGQINGTSGYEEAAGQGLIAGINAGLRCQGKEPLILKRNESYIGVLLDDLTTKGTKEPYRLLNSRAEYRLILRHDNADLRLRKYGYEVGTIDDEQYARLNTKIDNINNLIDDLKNIRITSKNVSDTITNTIGELSKGESLYDLLKRPEIKIDMLKEYITNDYSNEIYNIVEIQVKYEGYINKTNKEVEKMLKLEEKEIPSDINYDDVQNLASEARQKLKQVMPLTIAQASRISGVNPSDIAVLTVYLKKEYNK